MARIAPFHSANPSDPHVYHECSNCPPGQQIPYYNRRDGKGVNRQCQTCAAMIRNGTC